MGPRMRTWAPKNRLSHLYHIKFDHLYVMCETIGFLPWVDNTSNKIQTIILAKKFTTVDGGIEWSRVEWSRETFANMHK